MLDKKAMKIPKLACCNFIQDPVALKEFALTHGLDGIDWSFTAANAPNRPAEESRLMEIIDNLDPLEVRYHCAIHNMDLGDTDRERSKNALRTFKDLCRTVAKLGGRFFTIHVGLGRSRTHDLSWEDTVARLSQLVQFANNLGVRICLENLAWGWTSRPHLFEKLIRKSGAYATLDIGHAKVSPYVTSQHYDLEDFVGPQPDRFLNAHVYNVENSEGHLAPASLSDMESRLSLLRSLPLCDWWVLELHREEPLLQTLRVAREFFRREKNGNELRAAL